MRMEIIYLGDLNMLSNIKKMPVSIKESLTDNATIVYKKSI